MADAPDGTDTIPEAVETLSSRLTRPQWTTVAAAMGIGSAAIVAGLLYTNRRKPAKRAPPREATD